MPKPTKEEMQGSKELEQFNAALESLGIRPKDKGHPLAEFPPERLKNVLATVHPWDNNSWTKTFINGWFQSNGYGVTKRQIGRWLNDSRMIPAIQVARIADWLAHTVAGTQNPWAQETCGRLAETPEFLNPYSFPSFDCVYPCVVEALFRTDAATRIKNKRLALIASVLDMDEQALDALTAVAGLAKHDCWYDVSSASANDGLEDAARFVSDIINRRDIAAECTELSDWAAKWSGMVNRPEPLDLPF